MDKNAGWWAGRSADYFTAGPCRTKEEAIDEAFSIGDYEEIETLLRVYYAECGDLRFECDECGTVPEACSGCKEALYPEEYARTFGWCRNEGFADRESDNG